MPWGLSHAVPLQHTNLVALDLRRASHPAGGCAGMQNTSRTTIDGAILKPLNRTRAVSDV